MNQYLLALVGLLAIFIVGAVSFRLAANDNVKKNKVALDVPRFLIAGVGMYVIALAFIYLYNHVSFDTEVTGPLKGLYLALLVGIPFWGIPFFADADYLRGDSTAKWTVLANWLVSFAALGLVMGYFLQ